MSSEFGRKLKIQIFGQSHSEAIGVVIDNFPCGIKVDIEKIQSFMQRRTPGNDLLSTQRKEPDKIEIISGVYNGYTCGAPICAIIANTNTKSTDYSEIADKPRPSHADFAAHQKYNGFNDVRGGGHFSGRLTAPLCFAGALCMQYLEQLEIYVGAHISCIGKVKDNQFDSVNLTKEHLLIAQGKSFPALCDEAAELMKKEILIAKERGDSIGGAIECAVVGLPVGLGGGMFGGVENILSSAMFSIPAVKGIEFGSGFEGCLKHGSEYNDEYYYDRSGLIKAYSNNNGGITGGMTNGMPLLFRVAIKPTPSVFIEQKTVSFKEKKDTTLVIKGRHDPCILKRAIPAVEAVCAFAITDIILYNE